MKNKIINKLLGEPLCNMAQSFLDGFVEANVNHRYEMGVKSVIIRQMLSNCCNWCKNLAGIYDYGNEPINVYQRHDHCKCVVTFKTVKYGYQNVHTKQKFATYKEARNHGRQQLDDYAIDKSNRINKAQDLYEKMRLRYAVNKKLRIAAESGANVADVTDAYLNNKPSGGIVVDQLFYKGRSSYLANGKTVKFDPKGEKQSTNALVDAFGGVVEVKSRVTIPQGIRTADYSINGMDADIKTSAKHSRNAIRRIVEDAKGQAVNVVLNLDKNTMGIYEAERYIKEMFNDNRYSWLQMIIVIKDRKVKKIYQRVKK